MMTTIQETSLQVRQTLCCCIRPLNHARMLSLILEQPPFASHHADVFEGETESSMGVSLGVAHQGTREYVLVATSSGRVLKGSRQGAFCASPWEYEAKADAEEGEITAPSPLCSLETCPRDDSLFATSSIDGSTHVFRTDKREPLVSLYSKTVRPALSVFWSRLRPYSLFQVDDSGQLSFWDLTAVPESNPGVAVSVTAHVSEDLTRMSGLSGTIRRVVAAPRTPGDCDLIAVASSDGGVSCLVIKTPPAANPSSPILGSSTSTLPSAASVRAAPQLDAALSRNASTINGDRTPLDRIDSVMTDPEGSQATSTRQMDLAPGGESGEVRYSDDF